MTDQIIAQCMDCGHKEELTERFAPGARKCHECSGPLTQYVSRMLSPEELAKYGPAVPNKKPHFTKDAIKKEKLIDHKPIEEMDTMTTPVISREEYLIRRRDGEKRTAIFDSLGLGTTQYYKLLTEWGIKDSKVEQRYIDLIPARKEAEVKPIVEETTSTDVDDNWEPDTEEPVEEDPVAVEPELEAAPPIIAPVSEPEPIAEEPVNGISEPVTEVKLLSKVPMRLQYEPPAVVKEFTRSITIKTDGPQTDITNELHALLAYVGAMKGREFQLELYLGEVKQA